MTLAVRRLVAGDEAVAARLFALLACELGDDHRPLPSRRRRELLSRSDTWIVAAFDAHVLVGGLTAHVLPMTRSATEELFVYDVAVAAAHRRRGFGRALFEHLRTRACTGAVGDLWVLATAADREACAFYRALGARATSTRMFTIGP